jgi:hypothetical protein
VNSKIFDSSGLIASPLPGSGFVALIGIYSVEIPIVAQNCFYFQSFHMGQGKAIFKIHIRDGVDLEGPQE